MENERRKIRRTALIVTIILLLLAISGGTYAWFTYNRVVETDRATARTGDDTVKLEISSDTVRWSDVSDIVQINVGTDREKLMPVSTDDLAAFVYSPFTDDQMAKAFAPVEDEKYYYHGVLYLRARASGSHNGQRMALYLENGSDLVSGFDQYLLNAARLGLTFDKSNPVIFKLSSAGNKAEDQAYNTELGGVILGDDQVLHYEGGKVSAAKDPSVSLDSRSVIISNGTAATPEMPLMMMDLNKTYTVDVYFYLEGCDPDCSNAAQLQGTNLELAFYGVLG